MESRIQASQPQGALRTLLLAFLVGISLWHVSRYWGCVVDDSFIHLRYARNFIDGHGLVFNPGERVEGYTDNCFVLLAALFLKLQIDPLAGLKCLTAALAVWTLWLTARLERVVAGPQPATEVLPFSVLSLFPLGAFVYWAFCPMGTMLFTALLLGSLSLTLHERTAGRWLGSGLAFVLLGLARPEGVYVFGICTAVLALVDYLYGRNWNHLGCHAANVALFVILFGTYVAWRYHYYGNVLPNTFYAKATGGAGHRRGWGAYVLRRRPRVILWYNSAGSGEPFYLSDHELAADPLFRFFYQLRTATLPPLGGESAGRTAIRRFIGFPFGFSPAGEAPMANLGMSAVFQHGIVDLTTFFEGPILVTYFELDRRDEILWEDGLRLLGSDVRGFADSVAER